MALGGNADTTGTQPKAAPAAATSVMPVSPALAALQHYLPPSVLGKVQGYFTNPALTPADASSYALQFVRTTPWYQQTFPGIQQGINNGLFSDENGYRAHENQLSQLYQQYLGRPASKAEVAHSVTQGLTLSRVDAGLSGQAYITANQGDIQATLGAFDPQGAATAPELRALGQQHAGINSPLGEILQRRLTLAQQRIQGAFKGTLAQPGMSFASGRLAGVLGNQPSDVSA